jgi:crotonobetainyl-CoA:carnitine CoA-transferase CaiB-like acyl-CoA transferase
MNADTAVNSATEAEALLPLSGMRVVELTHAWAGPLCGMMLADMGADVIKVESPSQPPEARGGFPYAAGESVIFMMTHRNKKSVTLDLKDPRGLAAFRKLIETADVLIQNMRPGTMEKLGCSFENLRAVNPGLIYTSVSGFGPTGPDAKRAGVDQAAIAMSGLAATTMADPLSKPIALGTPICDYMAAMWACHGTLCAYIARRQTGRGQKVDSSLLGAGVSMMIGPTAMTYHTADYTGLKTPINGPSEFFLAADQRWVAVFASYPALWDRFVEAMDLPEVAADERFKTRQGRTANARQLAELLAPVFAGKTCREWVALLSRAGVPASAVNTIGETFEEPQVKALDLLKTVDHPTAGPVRVIATPVELSETPASVRTAAPLLGQDTNTVLRSLSFSDAEIGDLRKHKVIA